MGTHNRLSGLGPGEYLEVIAVDPEADAPERPRWFDLDRRNGGPRLATWVARTDDLDAALARYPEAGRPVTFARGAYRWRMAVRDDGAMPFDGCFPALIEWRSARPAFPDAGLRLVALRLAHPEAETLAPLLAALMDDPRVTVEAGAPSLTATIDTADGPRTLA